MRDNILFFLIIIWNSRETTSNLSEISAKYLKALFYIEKINIIKRKIEHERVELNFYKSIVFQKYILL